MTVKELIKYLELAPNKDVEVFIYHTDYENTLEIDSINLCLGDHVDIVACFNANDNEDNS